MQETHIRHRSHSGTGGSKTSTHRFKSERPLQKPQQITAMFLFAAGWLICRYQLRA